MMPVALLTCAVLAWVVVEDMRRYVVRNASVLLLVGCVLVEAAARHDPRWLAAHAIFGALGFALMAGAFAARMLGGGDAKLLSVALLWVGPEGCFVFAVLLLACTLVYAAGAWLGWLPARRVGARMAIPFGPSVATAWIAYIGLLAWL